MKCSNCGTENPERFKFCHERGSSLAVETSPGEDPRLASLQQAAPQGVQEKLRAAGESVEDARKFVITLTRSLSPTRGRRPRIDLKSTKFQSHYD